jgi:hypothetical protein
MFPGYLIWDLAKYCNSQEGRFAKIGMLGGSLYEPERRVVTRRKRLR